MKRHLLLLLILTAISSHLWASSPYSLYFGLGPGLSEISPANHKSTHGLGMGVKSQVTYQYQNFEIGFGSTILFNDFPGLSTPIRDIIVESQGEYTSGDADYRSVSFGPTLRYRFMHFNPIKDFQTYVEMGPVFAVQEVSFEEDNKKFGKLSKNEKLQYESYGVAFSIGIMGLAQNKVAKKMASNTFYQRNIAPILSNLNPLFFELHYRTLRSRKLSLVGGPRKEKEVISEEPAISKLSEHTVFILLGMKLF